MSSDIPNLDDYRKKKGLPTSDEIAMQKEAEKIAEELMKSPEDSKNSKKDAPANSKEDPK